MLKQKLLHWLAKLGLGHELAMALVLLRLIIDAIESRKVTDVSRFVYGKLPADWRHPEGPATETEFLEMVQAGQNFLAKLKAVFKP